MDHPAYQSTQTPPPTSNQTPVQPNPDPQPTAATTPPQNPKSRNWKKWIIIGGAFLVILLTGTAYVLSQQKESKKPETPAKQSVSKPTPTPDPTANWITYNDTYLGGSFSIEHPFDWESKQVQEGTLRYTSIASPNYRIDNGIMLIIKVSDTDKIDIEQWFSDTQAEIKKIGDHYYTDKKTMMVGGVPAIQYKARLQLPATETVFIKNNKLFTFTMITEDPIRKERVNTFNQILQTFKFTEQISEEKKKTPCFKTCDIKEWGVKLSFADANKLDYAIETYDRGQQTVHFYLNSTVSKDACSTIHARRYKDNPPQQVLEREGGRAIQLGNYFYTVSGQHQAICAGVTSERLNTTEVQLQEQLIQKIIDDITQGQYTLTQLP